MIRVHPTFSSSFLPPLYELFPTRPMCSAPKLESTRASLALVCVSSVLSESSRASYDLFFFGFKSEGELLNSPDSPLETGVFGVVRHARVKC